jgi:diaminopimelate epimerase
MQIEFYKYEGTGNDFVLIDNRDSHFSKVETDLVIKMCDRKFGIGADGLILLENHPTVDFTMIYYNADGHPGSMCGNGGRCIVHFAKFLNIISSEAVFEASDGLHKASIEGSQVSLKMSDVSEISMDEDFTFLDTGSPHHVTIVENLAEYDVYSKGKQIRNDRYGIAGSNVNFVAQEESDLFSVRTFERGVENETLSCGTGVTAVAIAMHATGKTTSELIRLKTSGGDLEVSFYKTDTGYENVHLKGPTKQVFKGIWK